MRLKTFSKKKKKNRTNRYRCICECRYVCVWGEGGCRVVSCEEEGRGCSHSPSHFLATIFTLTLKRKKEKKIQSNHKTFHCTCKSLKPTSARLFSSKSGVSSCPWDMSLKGGCNWEEKGDRGVCWEEPSTSWVSFFNLSWSCRHQNVTSARRSATRSDEFISKVP